MRRLLPILALLVSCNHGRSDLFEARPDFLDPVQLEDSVAYVSRTLEQVHFVSWDEEAAEVRVVTTPAGRAPYRAFTSLDGSSLLLICHGAQEGEVAVEDVEEESLLVYDSSFGSERYVLSNPFNALAQSDRWAILFFETMVPGTNPNLLAIVDRTQPPSATNPRIISIRTLGSIPLSIVVAEQVPVLAEPSGTVLLKDLALVLSNSYITLFDLENLDNSEITVPLVVPEDGIDIVPIAEDVIISRDPTGLSSRVILRSDSSSDIFSLTFVGLDVTSGNDYRVSLNQLSVDVDPHDAPTDMSPFVDSGRDMVLVTTVSSDTLAIVDPETTMVTTVSVEFPVERSLVYDSGRMAFLYSRGERLAYFLTLADVLTEKERNLREFSYGGSLASLSAVPNTDYVVMTLAEEPQKLYILDLLNREMSLVNLFSASSPQILMYPSGDHILISPPALSEIWFIADMSSFQIDRILLDSPVHDVWLLSSRIVIDHDSPEGYLTFLDLMDPRRSTAVSVRGFLLRGTLGIHPGNYPLGGAP